MHKKTKVILIIFTAIWLVAVGLGGWLFFNNKKILAEIVDAERNIHDLELKVLSYGMIKEEYAKVGDQGVKLKNRFVDPDKPVVFIQLIEEAAKESQVELSIEIHKLEEKSKKKKDKEKDSQKKVEKPALALRLTTESDFNSLVNFIIKLENLGQYSHVSEISMKKQKLTVSNSNRNLDDEAPEEIEEKEVLISDIIIYAK